MPSMPVGLSRDLPAKRVMRAQVGAQDMVVWRATNGQIAAWDNRCPHRGMALSHGFVRGNALACLYHGWHYERSGACSYIPAHPDLEPPATIHAVQFSVLEQDGVIWVDTEGPANAAPVPDRLEPLRTFLVEAGADLVLDACAKTPLDGQTPTAAGAGMFDFPDGQVCVLCNPIGPGRTQVTILTSPGLSVARRCVLSRWCEAMRRMAEAATEVLA